MNTGKIIFTVSIMALSLSCGTSIVAPEPEPELDVIDARTNLPDWLTIRSHGSLLFCRPSATSPDTLLYLSQSFTTPDGLGRGGSVMMAVIEGHDAVPIVYDYRPDSGQLPWRTRVLDRDHDVGLATLRLDTTRANTLRVNRFDPEEMYIEGTFDVQFVYDSGRRASDPLRVLPDTVYYADGYFRLHAQVRPCSW